MVENNKVNESLLKDDLYQAVNGEWLKTAVIPADRPTAGGFSELDLNIEKTLMHDLGEMLEGKNVPDDKHLKEFLKYYKLASDFETRNAEGFEPAKKYLDAVLAIKDLQDWQDKWLDFALIDAANPFSFFVDPDMKNTQEYALYADVTPLFLPDKTYYEEGNEQGAALLSVLSDMLEKLFEKAGYDAEFAKKTISEAIEYDRLIAPFQKTAQNVPITSKFTIRIRLKTSPSFRLQSTLAPSQGKSSRRRPTRSSLQNQNSMKQQTESSTTTRLNN